MKTRLSMLAAAMLLGVAQVNAQWNSAHCGNSGSTVCTSAGTLAVPGYANPNTLPCIVRGQQTDLVINFRNGTQYSDWQGGFIAISSARIDTVGGMPEGLCWATNKADDTFAPDEHGCVKISGITLAEPGQYRLYITYAVNTGQGNVGWVPHENIFTTATIFLRVVNNATNICPPVDTTAWGFVPNENPDGFSKVAGKVYYDLNNNNTYDIGDLPLRNTVVNIGSHMALTNSLGSYQAYLPVGTYNVVPALGTGVTSYAPANITVAVASNGLLYDNKNFGAQVSPGYCEGALSVTNVSMPPRPGFDNIVRFGLVNNLSESPVSQTVRINLPPSQTYISASVTPSVINTTGNYLEFAVNNLVAGQAWHVDVELNTPTSVSLGTTLRYNMAIANSSCVALNTVQRYELTVVGSYDPNDKAVSPIGFSDHHGINPNHVKTLTYKVRFQNTGTFLAEKVVVVDTISPNLDLTTLQVMSASHNYEVAIGDDRAVKFIFNQIMLPDSNSDEPNSHGYIQFTIDLKESLAQNTQVLNKADIYFDFNLPIRTNTAYNTVDYSVVGIKEAANSYSLSLYPNPASNMATLTIDKELVGKEVQLLNLSGQVLQSITATDVTTTFDLSKLAAGVYVVKVDNATTRLVKQ